jgi:predicted dehydrogenase
MAMQHIRTALIGTGFMGRTHAEAIRRLGNVEIAAVASLDEPGAREFAERYGIDRATGDYRTILGDAAIDAVHVLTPNALHREIALTALEAGKHVVCEKPLTVSVAEARELVAAAERSGRANCVEHNLRYYPLVQQARQMIAAGELGEILIAQGTYSQDWLLYDTDWNWRADAKMNGPLRAMGDIGSHWMDMIQHVTGLSITALCADLATFHRTRKMPRGAVETFGGRMGVSGEYQSIPVDTDDFGAVMLRLGERARGVFTVSQVSAGRKNHLRFEIFGTKKGLAWDQERPDELWIGERDSANRLLLKDPSLLEAGAASYADYPGGHAEGYPDTHKQVLKRFYRKVADPSAPVEYPTFADGLCIMQLLEKVRESARERTWVEIPADNQRAD